MGYTIKNSPRYTHLLLIRLTLSFCLHYANNRPPCWGLNPLAWGLKRGSSKKETMQGWRHSETYCFPSQHLKGNRRQPLPVRAFFLLTSHWRGQQEAPRYGNSVSGSRPVARLKVPRCASLRSILLAFHNKNLADISFDPSLWGKHKFRVQIV